jgi:predicted transcriptional regulator of viral defense system
MTRDAPRTLAKYATRLLSGGRVVFSREEAQAALGVSRGAFLDAAERQQRQGHLIRPRRGFYVVVPPQYLTWGAPPPSWYIDSLMRHEGRAYYVGLLKAAEVHGASHQAVMAFQVVTDKRMPDIRAGRSTLTFHYRRDMDAVVAGIIDRKTDTGSMKVSSVELTTLDLLRYSHAAAGLDHIVTVLRDLGSHCNAGKLGELASAFPRSVGQRLGHLLDAMGYEGKTGALHRAVVSGSALPWIELEPVQITDADLTPEPIQRDPRWHVIVRRVPEPDE